MRITLKLLQLLITIVGVTMFSASILLASAQSTTNATASAASTVRDGMFNPTAHLDTAQIDDLRDTAEQDAAAEGQDVLPLSYHEAPADLWTALPDEWYDDDVPSLGTVWVPVGTVVDVPGGLYLATLDGWFTCEDWTTTGEECGPNEQGEIVAVSTDIEPVPATVIYGADEAGPCGSDDQCTMLDADRELAGLPALDGPAYGTEDGPAQVLNVAHVTHIGDGGNRVQMCQAARHILKRLGSTRPMFEDWTWRGAPRVVGAQNDALLDAAERAGLHGNDWPFSVKAAAWLHRYVKGCRN